MDNHSQDDHDSHEEHGGMGQYFMVFLALCGLTACSFMTVAEWWPFDKTPTMIFMMGVSTVKAMLVILFFMHLKWEANWKYVLTVPAAMMSLFLVLMLIPDIGLRSYWYSEERTAHAATTLEVHDEHGGEHVEGHAAEGEHAHEESAAPAAGH